MKKCKKMFAAVLLSFATVMASPVIMPKTGTVAEAKAIKLSDTTLELMPDEYYQMEVKNADSQKITWKSSNEKVMKITSKGKVHSVGAGGESCTITATVGKKTLKCKATVMDVQGYGLNTYLIWISNWTYRGYDIKGKKVSNVIPQYMEVFKYKGKYCYIIETEGGNQGTECVAHNFEVFEIGKKLPSCMKNPMCAVYEDGKETYLAKKVPKGKAGEQAVNILLDAKGNLVVEKARNYTDKQWKTRLKELGYK